MNKLFSISTLLLSLSMCAAQAATETKATAAPAAPVPAIMKAGLWEITIANETSGSPVKHSLVSQSCYSPADLNTPAKLLPPQQEIGQKCAVRDVVFKDDGASWKLSCTAKGMTLAGHSSVTMKPDSYTGSATLEKKTGGKSAKVTQTMNGKYLGACK